MFVQLTLTRQPDNGRATVGRLTYKSLDVLTLEDINRDLNSDGVIGPGEKKIPGESRIPKGLYRLILRKWGSKYLSYTNKYPFHRGMIEIWGVNGFLDVLFHIGNKPEDTRGCILIGGRYEGGSFISDSEKSYLFFYGYVLSLFDQGHEIFLKVIDT